MDQNPNRTNPDETGEYLPLAEAAQRLGIAYDTARKRLKAGALQGERRNGRWYVLIPGPESHPESGPEPKPNTSGTESDDSGPIPDEAEPGPDDSGPNPDALVAALQDEVTFLRQQLDHQTRIIAGLVQRIPELQALPESASAPVGAQEAPGRVDPPQTTNETLQSPRTAPSAGSEGLLQRLWRAIAGG